MARRNEHGGRALQRASNAVGIDELKVAEFEPERTATFSTSQHCAPQESAAAHAWLLAWQSGGR